MQCGKIYDSPMAFLMVLPLQAGCNLGTRSSLHNLSPKRVVAEMTPQHLASVSVKPVPHGSTIAA